VCPAARESVCVFERVRERETQRGSETEKERGRERERKRRQQSVLTLAKVNSFDEQSPTV